MIEESKWKNFQVFTDAFIHWLQSISNILEKKSNYRHSEKESHESQRSKCNLLGKKVSDFRIISNNVVMKICLVLLSH